MLEKMIRELQAKKIITNLNCWEINYVSTASGHVQIKYEGIAYLIHRVSLAYHLNLDYKDMSWLALHKNECNNPRCWNPDHLYKGTQKKNIDDSIELNTHFNLGKLQEEKRKNKTHCPKGHPHTKRGACPECNKIRVREFKRKQRNSIRRYVK